MKLDQVVVAEDDKEELRATLNQKVPKVKVSTTSPQRTSGSMPLLQTIVKEAWEYKRRALGETAFSSSSLQDAHIQQLMALTAKLANVPLETVVAHVNHDIAKMMEGSKKAPILYETMIKNAAESAAYSVYWRAHMPPKKETMMDVLRRAISGEPELPKLQIENPQPVGERFRRYWFNMLLRHIKAEIPKFFPLRGFVDRRVALNIKIVFIPDPDLPDVSKYKIDTACATPNAEFVFNETFMQTLLDYAAIKQIKPQGAKYQCNGGDIPDGYAYIEFIILHELLHYTEEDFYYQKIIPDAHPTIINYVGDFRSNYNLVKSGYEQLPIGLFNDHVNFDRQNEYIQMYNLVKEELEKLKPEEREAIEGELDDQTDSHEPGQEEGKEGPEGSGKPKEKWIPKVGEKVKLPDGSPGVVRSVEGEHVEVDRL
jgi:hypothetical protein